ncbi:MAG: hypothetical protein ABI380_12220 [Edaphobacter sp.]
MNASRQWLHFVGEGLDGGDKLGKRLGPGGLWREDNSYEGVVGFFESGDGGCGIGLGDEGLVAAELLDAVAQLEEIVFVGSGLGDFAVVVGEEEDALGALGAFLPLVDGFGLVAEKIEEGGERGVVLCDTVADLFVGAVAFDEAKNFTGGTGCVGDRAGVVCGRGDEVAIRGRRLGVGCQSGEAGTGCVGVVRDSGFAFALGESGEGGGVFGEGEDGVGAKL